MSDESGEKTEEPTQKKIDDTRKRGQVWKSKDLTGVVVFLVGLGALKAVWPMVEGEISKLFFFGFEKIAHPRDLERATFHLLLMGAGTIVLLTLPSALGAAIVGGLVEFLQVGPLMSNEALMPKLEKLNPLAGLKNMVSKKQLVELIKSTLKMLIAGYVVYGVVRDSMGLVVNSVRGNTETLMVILGELVFRVSVKVGLLFMAFAIFDVWWQRRVYIR